MIVTGAFFAQMAEIVDQKLNVTGGVLDWLETDLNSPFPLNLIILLQSGLEDSSRDTHDVTLEVFGPSGPAGTIAGPMQWDRREGENRFWLTPFNFVFTEYGRHVFVFSIDNSTVSLPLTVRPVSQRDLASEGLTA